MVDSWDSRWGYLVTEANPPKRLGAVVVLMERTFGWLNRYRRLSYELYTKISEAMIYSALIQLMLRRKAA